MKIIESLQRLMPEPKRAFWNTIQTDNRVADLMEIDITEDFEKTVGKKKQKAFNQVQNVKVGYLEHEVLADKELIIFSRSSAYGAKLDIPNFTCDKEDLVKRNHVDEYLFRKEQC
ncbi:hypothetical protein RRG08_031372 [Elysia crispata]|uniref:Uncharacterized protein n=1 Tax=Elysia crispata TaxID=231223 RepID=A0AAE1DK47_9GAST|nr:hypothetical protein RRG08_031372 [Elysia crispata]